MGYSFAIITALFLCGQSAIIDVRLPCQWATIAQPLCYPCAIIASTYYAILTLFAIIPWPVIGQILLEMCL